MNDNLITLYEMTTDMTAIQFEFFIECLVGLVKGTLDPSIKTVENTQKMYQDFLLNRSTRH